MFERPPVFVYGATGYTGRLTCHDLKRRGISFTIGGRSRERLEALRNELGDSNIPIAPVEHNVNDLVRTFKGHQIVINITGPYSLLGEAVVQAALAAGCHYLDTTGEQDFMLLIKERYGPQAKKLNRVVINANSWYYTLGEAAAHYLRDSFPQLDTYTIAYRPEGDPTVASTQSIFRTARRSGFHYVDGKLVPIRFDRLVSVEVPGEERPSTGFNLPAGEVIHLGSEKNVRTVRAYVLGDRMVRIYPLFKWWSRFSKPLGRYADTLSDRLVGWLMKTPPPEKVEETPFMVMATAAGNGGDKRISLLSGNRPYVVTGFIGGQASEWLIAGKQKRAGVLSTAQAFGAVETIEALKQIGVTHKVI